MCSSRETRADGIERRAAFDGNADVMSSINKNTAIIAENPRALPLRPRADAGGGVQAGAAGRELSFSCMTDGAKMRRRPWASDACVDRVIRITGVRRTDTNPAASLSISSRERTEDDGVEAVEFGLGCWVVAAPIAAVALLLAGATGAALNCEALDGEEAPIGAPNECFNCSNCSSSISTRRCSCSFCVSSSFSDSSRNFV
mmetsp:Transcript_15420/g.33199  ORF Transcript_15420/g.33199 Transcript_15420/m.33199 type:complete len:201 (-) Transcript_15420:592-1194(-)